MVVVDPCGGDGRGLWWWMGSGGAEASVVVVGALRWYQVRVRGGVVVVAPLGATGGPLSHCACCEPGAAAAGSVACLPDVPVRNECVGSHRDVAWVRELCRGLKCFETDVLIKKDLVL